MIKQIVKLLMIATFIWGCDSQQKTFDACGTFEADEIIVSARQTGQIQSLQVDEGQELKADEMVGKLDMSSLELQKEQVNATINSLEEKLTTASPQIGVLQKQLAVQQTQLEYLEKEKNRIQNLLKADAATPKQLDDIEIKVQEANRQIAVIKQQVQQQSVNARLQNRSILSEKGPLSKSGEQIQNQISKGDIVNPVTGRVLMQYAFAGEMATVGKPLYKIANLDTINLRAYITGSQLPHLKIAQQVTVKVDDGGKYRDYKGVISWISDQAEFTPKTIQTKDERENLVYAIKIEVPNDGYLKIGMYGEVNF